MSDPSPAPPHMTALVEARELHMEILDPATRDVWQSHGSVSRERYEGFDEPGFVRVGIGRGNMDQHWFRRSPGAKEDGPMEARDFAGLRFVRCARAPAQPPALPGGPTGPRELEIDKHHGLRFEAGREIQLLSLPDGRDFVHVIVGGGGARDLPEGWRLRTCKLGSAWVVDLPAPAVVFFFPNGDSFQGPLDESCGPTEDEV